MEIRAFFNRNWRYLVFALVTFLVFWVLYTWRAILLPFLIGLLLAYLMAPIVRFVERRLPGKGRWAEAKRVSVILFLMVLFLGIFAFAVFILVTTLLHSSANMIANASQLINDLIARGKEWTQAIRNLFPASMQAQVDAAISNLGNSLAGTLTGSLTGGQSVGNQILGSLGTILGFAAVPLFLFYLLKDSEKIQKNIYAELPPTVARHTRSVIHSIDCVLGRYIRGELLLGAVVGSMSLVGLLIIGAPFALPLAAFNGFCEMIPTVGPVIGGTVMGLVTLALSPEKAILVVLLAVGVQLLENNLLVPKVMGNYLRLHPALILVLLVIGGSFWGFWGLVLTVPLTATVVDIFGYVRSVNREANTPADAPEPPATGD